MHILPIRKLIIFTLWLLTPLLGFSQEKRKRTEKNWSFSQTEKAAQIPLVQELMIDSINFRINQLTALQPTLLQPSILDSQGLALKDLANLKANLQKLQSASQQQPFSLSSLPALYSLKSKLPNLTRNPFQLKINEAKLTTVYDNQALTSNRFLSQASLDFSTNLLGIPFSYSVVNNYPAFPSQPILPLFKASFNQDQLLKEVKGKLNSQYDVEKLLLKDLDFKNLFRQYGEKKLEALKTEAISKAGLSNVSLIGLKDLKVDEFLYLTKEQLSERIVNKVYLDSLVQATHALQAVLPLLSTSQERDSIAGTMAAIDQQLSYAKYIVAHAIAAKENFETKGLDYNQLVRYQQLVNKEAGNIASSSSFTQQASRKLLHLNGLTRLFMHMKQLDIGQFSGNWSPRSMSDVLTSGLSGQYLNKNKFMGLTVANTQPLGRLKDQAFTGNLSEPASRIQALRLGKGELAGAHNHFTMVNASIKTNSGSLPSLPALPRNVAVGGFSKNVSLGKYGNIAAEVAKSNTQYQNTSNVAGELESKVALQHFGADFLQTLSVGVTYENQFAKAGFAPQVFINYAGLGYSNPASALQARGSLHYGFQARKDLLGKKLTLQSRFTKRENRLTVLDDRKMHQVQSSLAARYRISKKWRLGANWNYSTLSKEDVHYSHQLFRSNRLGIDGFYNGRLWGKPIYQYVGTGYQRLYTPGLNIGMNGGMFWVNTSTTMAFDKGSLASTLQYYNNLSSGDVQSDLLTADMGWNYVLLKKVQVNTSINYLNQKTIAQQAGIRQMVSTSLKKNIALSLFADVKHDLIDNMNPYLYPKTRGELQVTYKLN